MRAMIFLMPALFLSGCSVVGVRTAEEAGYKVLRQQDQFEIRNYDGYTVVETRVDQNFEEAQQIAFRRLFDYISGQNKSERKVSMTAPVVMQPIEGTELPRFAVKGESGWTISFVLPREYTLETAPTPKSELLSLRWVAPKRVAVSRFSGAFASSKFLEQAAQLQQWLEREGESPQSAPRLAGFDPPWTLPFLRRNEVQVDLE